jgi:hypothetical protein
VKDDALIPLYVVSMRGVGQEGWYIFKHLEDGPHVPDAIGVIDGPFPTREDATLEAQAMKRRRLALDRATR